MRFCASLSHTKDEKQFSLIRKPNRGLHLDPARGPADNPSAIKFFLCYRIGLQKSELFIVDARQPASGSYSSHSSHEIGAKWSMPWANAGYNQLDSWIFISFSVS
jgi:hypothetical protein